jgi:hypothetical protein
MSDDRGRRRAEARPERCSAYSTSSSSSSEDEGDRRKSRKSSKNLRGLSCFAGETGGEAERR